MTYKYLTATLSGMILCLFIGFAGCSSDSSAEPDRTYVHFFVAPKFMPDGSPADDRLDALRLWLAQEAGGYTELGDAPGGWITAEGNLQTEDQVAFVVTANFNLKATIRQYMMEHFDQTLPYVVVWETLL